MQRKRLFLSVVCGSFLLAACGDGGSDDAAAPGGSNPPPQGNRAPTISGSPSTEVAVGSMYSFTPTASDPDGDPLTFSVSNLPSWASFEASTGRISGTPGPGDLAQFSNIVISVSDGTVSRSLAAFSVEVVSVGTGSVLLSWDPPTQNTDGSALTDLNHYMLYWGPSPGDYTGSTSVAAGLTSYMVEGLTPGTWYFAATAVNDSNLASSFSNIAQKTIL